MANISVTALYAQKQRQFGQSGNDSVRVQKDFITAINRAARRINRQADLETRITAVSDTNGTMALDEAYEDVLSDLVTLNLIDMGSRPPKSIEKVIDTIRATVDERIDDIRQDIMNIAMEADTDDETDFVGLGARGT